MHHEFKLTSKNQLKTIELNWRIWWIRLEMYNEAYWINMLEIPFDKNKFKNFLNKSNKLLKNNYVAFTLYSVKEWTLIWYNEDIIKKIKNLNSFNTRVEFKSHLWKKVWLAKKWYIYTIKITLKNNNYGQIKEDIQFIKDNYKKLYIIE